VLHGFRVFDRDFHQVFSPKNITFENSAHLTVLDLSLPFSYHAVSWNRRSKH
jgi:hypothetical protein